MAKSSSQITQEYSLYGQVISRESIFVSYTFIAGIFPQQNGAQIAIWSSTNPLWDSPPTKMFPINNNESSGEIILEGLQVQGIDYTLALLVGPSARMITALSSFKPGTTVGRSSALIIDVVQTGPDALRVSAKTPSGNVPSNNENWIGIWEGEANYLNSHCCLQRTPVVSLRSSFTEMISNLPLKFDSVYTLAYGVGPDWNQIGATSTFKTAPY